MTCGALRRDCYEEAEGMRRFWEQVDSCQGGELSKWHCNTQSMKTEMDQPLMGCPHG
jgi:hypothetical protein